jgi:hypothetical protein
MAKQEPKSTDLAKSDPAANMMILDQTQVPDHIHQGEARGNEGVGQDDIIIPRLELVQGLSPAVKEGDPGYIDGAKPGMLMNSVTKQLYGKEVMVVPVVYMKQWLVWRKRKFSDEKGREQTTEGGFFGSFNAEHEANARMAEEIKNSGIDSLSVEVIDTPQHLCLLVNFNNGTVEEVMVSMPRTKAKVSRQWNSMIRLAGSDRFSRVYRITSALEKRNGNDYYNFVVAQSGFPAPVLYKQAEKLYEQMQSGRAVTMDVTGFVDAEAPAAGADDSEM